MPTRNVLTQKKLALYNAESACNVLESLTIRSPVTEPQSRAEAREQLEQARANIAAARHALAELETITTALSSKWA